MGGPRFPIAMADHINQYFNPHTLVRPEQILTGSGLTAIHELIGRSLGDPGDGILVTKPIYGRFELDFRNTADLKIVYADTEGDDPFSPSVVTRYQTALKQATTQGTTIRALLIVNPHNPLGV